MTNRESNKEAEPVAWLHPTANWAHVSREEVAMHCQRDGQQPIPLFTSPQQETQTSLLSIIADIREASGLGAKPMLSELADAIREKIERQETEGREITEAPKVFCAMLTTGVCDVVKGWQPIETAPKDGTGVDLWVQRPKFGEPSFRVTNACWSGGEWVTQSRSFMFPVEGMVDNATGEPGIKATHWMPLPEPPRAERPHPAVGG